MLMFCQQFRERVFNIISKSDFYDNPESWAPTEQGNREYLFVYVKTTTTNWRSAGRSGAEREDGGGQRPLCQKLKISQRPEDSRLPYRPDSSGQRRFR